MDETRAKRISDHFAYHKARKEYRASLHNLYNSWRAELVAKQLADPGAQRRLKAEEAREEAARMAQLLREKRVATLVEQVRKAELEHKLAQVQLQRAVRRQEELQRRQEAREARYQRLLEASRNWIRHEDLEGAINRALDNPEPFGFVTSLKINRGF
ncbi:hypothetical protein HYH02_011734 [Chlamydomonas schloesseri]|uniref:Uncharacterized protein n=1 Tax=Chlamydomonas schloesseri TaxID=2026947 RepID=A0A835T2V8_9CHLO|nr:hypothetical protein HYH02_011734 [Chlamydomonas schloesseri]|eukprot:KAG2436022.1 hypothetical protein HYH02_011734 [Chlamydomonas schloesseri]